MKLKICLIAVLMATLSVFANDVACSTYLLRAVEDPSVRGTSATQLRVTARHITNLCSPASPELAEYALGYAAMYQAMAVLAEYGNEWHATQHLDAAIAHFDACRKVNGVLAEDADYRMRGLILVKQNMQR